MTPPIQDAARTADERKAEFDPIYDLKDLISTGVIGSRSAMQRAVDKGWLPQPNRFPNGRLWWRRSVIARCITEHETSKTN